MKKQMTQEWSDYYEFEIKPYPLLKITNVISHIVDYPSGGKEFYVVYVFKYKGKYYSLSEQGGT